MSLKKEDQYVERTPDLIAKIRAQREEAQRKMDRFTRIEDYDVRVVVGRGPAPKPKGPTSIDSAPAKPASSDGEPS